MSSADPSPRLSLQRSFEQTSELKLPAKIKIASCNHVLYSEGQKKKNDIYGGN
jgi:hypothetical protein